MAFQVGEPFNTRARMRVGRLGGVMFVALAVAASSAWHDISIIIGHGLSLTGIFLAFLGALGRLWCSGFMADNKNAMLVTVGPYSLCRNPLYLFSFIGGVGVSMATGTLSVPFMFAIAFLAYHRGVIQAEERVLHQLHGAAYSLYCRTVLRFWPKWSGYMEPRRWEIAPMFLRRSLVEVVEVIGFGAMAIAVHVLDELRMHIALPTLLQL